MAIPARVPTLLLAASLALFLSACTSRGTDKVAHSNQWIGDSVLLYSTLTTSWERKERVLGPPDFRRFNTTLRVYRTQAGSGQCSTKRLVLEVDSILPCPALLYRAEDSLAYFSYQPLNARSDALPLNEYSYACHSSYPWDTLRLFALKPWRDNLHPVVGTLDTATLLENLKSGPYSLFEIGLESGAICPPGCECISP